MTLTSSVPSKRRSVSSLGTAGRAALYAVPVLFFVLAVLLANRRGGFRRHNTRGHAQFGAQHRFLFLAQLVRWRATRRGRRPTDDD